MEEKCPRNIDTPIDKDRYDRNYDAIDWYDDEPDIPVEMRDCNNCALSYLEKVSGGVFRIIPCGKCMEEQDDTADSDSHEAG